MVVEVASFVTNYTTVAAAAAVAPVAAVVGLLVEDVPQERNQYLTSVTKVPDQIFSSSALLSF